MPLRKTTILAVDDEPRILRLLVLALETAGYRILTAADGEAALEILFGEEDINLVLLDIRLPGIDGVEVCRRIREMSQMPVIMVTAKDADDEKVAGLDAGADDYITKPFAVPELIARVRAVLRRASVIEKSDEPAFQSDGLVVDYIRHTVTLEGRNVPLTATEFKVLSYLTHNAGRVVTSDQLLEKVWGESYQGENNILQATMTRLRRKLGDEPRNPKYIVTRTGIGYTIIKHQAED